MQVSIHTIYCDFHTILVHVLRQAEFKGVARCMSAAIDWYKKTLVMKNHECYFTSPQQLLTSIDLASSTLLLACVNQ
jgi:hypothetical protein